MVEIKLFKQCGFFQFFAKGKTKQKYIKPRLRMKVSLVYICYLRWAKMEETDLKTLEQLPTGLLIGSVANFEITCSLTVLARLSSNHTGSCVWSNIPNS